MCIVDFTTQHILCQVPQVYVNQYARVHTAVTMRTPVCTDVVLDRAVCVPAAVQAMSTAAARVGLALSDLSHSTTFRDCGLQVTSIPGTSTTCCYRLMALQM